MEAQFLMLHSVIATSLMFVILKFVETKTGKILSIPLIFFTLSWLAVSTFLVTEITQLVDASSIFTFAGTVSGGIALIWCAPSMFQK